MKKIIAANWKMNMTTTETKKFLNQIIKKIKISKNDIILCIPTINLFIAKNQTKNTKIKIGAENFYFEDRGAYTGETSAEMLKDVGVDYVIIGHSERREIFKEDDLMINKKIKKAIKEKIKPIFCVGETLSEKETNKTFDKIKQQLINGLLGIEKKQISKIIIAYEPIWAIGTGKTATVEEMDEVCKFIKNEIKNIYDVENIKVLYGGSVNEKNVENILKQKNIDGVLVGGASLKLEFVNIANIKI